MTSEDEYSFEGTTVLEALAEIGRVDDFFEAIDADDIEAAVELMREAQLDRDTIAIVVKKIQDADGEH